MRSGRPEEDMPERYDYEVKDENNFRILMERIELEEMYRWNHLHGLPYWKRFLHWFVYWLVSPSWARRMFKGKPVSRGV